MERQNQSHGSSLRVWIREHKRCIEFNSTDIESALKTAAIKFAPTEIPRDYNVNELGDGLRSLFYFSLVNTLLRAEQDLAKKIEEGILERQILKILPPALTILVVEEPENHISPQLIGRVLKSLKETADTNNAQVVISSHTPTIIKRIKATDIRHFRVDEADGHSLVNQVVLPLKADVAHKFVKEAVEAYPEIYFAHLVVLGEGDSEMVVLPRIIEHTNSDIDVLGISIAPLGGSYVNHFWRLLRELKIPHITLLDLDRERNGGGWGRIKYVIDQLIEYGEDKLLLFNCNECDILTDDILENMHTRSVTLVTEMNKWIGILRNYNVYFCSPLDLDFVLLENYSEQYKNTAEKGHGPSIDGVGKIREVEKLDPLPDAYHLRVERNTKHILKDEGGDGSTYTDAQKRLMVWYKYLFLDRSKPVTHLKALFECDFGDLSDIPEPLKSIVQKIEKILS